jgi:methylenetetrahydrofolate dehydrogenase (NADP+)/methenyltetrahydrofolate cyclohydrolase
MTASILDGRPIAASIREATAARAASFSQRAGREVSLVAVTVAGDAASESYLDMQARAAAKQGLAARRIALAPDEGQAALERTIRALNADDSVDAILVTAPLPSGFDVPAARAALDPAKDVEGVSPVNLGRLLADQPGPRPATGMAVLLLAQASGIKLSGCSVTVVGRSVVVGKPAALLLLAHHATVTVAHSRTPDLGAATRTADLLVCAAGVAGLIRGVHVKPGAVVIDAGTNPVGEGEDSRLVGDSVHEEVVEIAGQLTPVPGGVGPITTALLLRAAVELAEARFESGQ